MKAAPQRSEGLVAFRVSTLAMILDTLGSQYNGRLQGGNNPVQENRDGDTTDEITGDELFSVYSRLSSGPSSLLVQGFTETINICLNIM